MAFTRERIYKALFDLLAADPLWKTSSRVLRLWKRVDAKEHPAIFQTQDFESVLKQSKQPAKKVLNVSLYLYVHRGGDPKAVPAILLNDALDTIDTILAPAPLSQTQTLGGLVVDCRINGTIETDEGTLEDQAVAIIPVEIIVPDNFNDPDNPDCV